jgi:competence protein ComEA
VKQLFNFHNREQKGVAILVLIAIILMLSNLYLSQVRQSDSIKVTIIQDANTTDKKSVHPQVFLIHPNTITLDSLKLLGVSDALANQWVNFREKFKPFESIEDVKKLYAMTDSVVARIESWIVWPKKTTKAKVWGDKKGKNTIYKKPKRTAVNVLINSATSTDFMQIRGIGPVFSERIIKYRELLGGFQSKNQLLEVYGMTDSLYVEIKNFIKLDSLPLNQLNVNSVDAKVLVKHPYIEWHVANSIVKYRAMHGCYQQLDDIKQSNLVNELLYDKIAPYLKADTCLLLTD